MKIAILTSGILPVPSVQGGAVENLIDFYLEYNEQHHLHDITVYSVWNEKLRNHAALRSSDNHYYHIDTISLWAKIKRKIYGMFHKNEYYNHYIEYYFEESYKHLRKEEYDCIILENRPGYALKLSQRGHKNLVLHLHNDLLNNETPHHQEIFNHLSQILTVSNYIKGRVSSIAPHNKIQTVYNGIDLTQFSRKDDLTVSREDLGLALDDFVVVFSGRINKDKGISELIDAMLLLQDTPHIKLLVLGSTFFGNAPNEDEFVCSLKIKAQNIKENIIFTGFVPYAQMPDYLQLADVAVIPSVWNDPFPTTVLEAQAIGLPVIVSNRGGILEEIGQQNAIVVNAGCNYIQQLVNAIQCLYKDSEKRGIMAVASMNHSKYFNKERFARDLFNTIKD